MRESIRGFADATIEASDARPTGRIRALLRPGPAPVTDLGQLSDDVVSFRDLLATSDELRTVLTDPGIPAHARRGVVTDLFGSRVGADALRLLAYVVGSGRAPELPDDVTAVAERVTGARDGLHPVGPAVLGHHAALERLDGFASAVLASEDEQGLAEIEDEMFRFERIVAGSEQLTTALTEPDLPAEARVALVGDLLDGKASPATVRLASYATTIGRPREYLDLLRALVDRVAAESHRRFAEVRSMVELTDAQQARLAAALGRIVGQPVEVRVVIDPSVLGGFVATIGDTVVDGSVRHRLDLLKERLGAPDATPTNEGAQS